MLLVEREHGLVLASPLNGHVRTPGIHASDLYGAFYREMDPTRYNKLDAAGERLPFDLTKMELGVSFESVLEPALRARLLTGERPGEFVAGHAPECPDPLSPVPFLKDNPVLCEWCGAGVIYSPDYLFDLDGDLVLGEFKLTWYSSAGAPTDPKFSIWWSQIRLYCYWLNLTRARLIVFFVNGDYRPPAPTIRCWEARFSRQELRDEATAILRHARRRGLLRGQHGGANPAGG